MATEQDKSAAAAYESSMPPQQPTYQTSIGQQHHQTGNSQGGMYMYLY